MQCNRTGDHIKHLFQLYHDWRPEEGLSAIVTAEEAAGNDYDLSPSRYVASDEHPPPLPLEEALVLLRQAADQQLDQVLTELGYAGWRSGE